MELSYVISWMVAAFLVNQWLRSLQHPIYIGRSWRIICPALGLVMLVVGFKKPEILGQVAAALFTLFVLLPNLAAKTIDKQLARGRYTVPMIAAQTARLFHPGDGLWDLPALIRILNLWSFDKKAQAQEIWESLPKERLVRLPYSYSLVLQIAGAFGEWENILNWSRALATYKDSSIEIYIPVVEIRALGELKRFDEQIARLESLFEKDPPEAYLATAILFCSAFQGRVVSVENILKEELRHFPNDTRQFWLATSLKYSGRDIEAEAVFRKIQPGAEPRTKRAIERRLGEPSSVSPSIYDSKLDLLENRLRQSFSLPDRIKRPYVTYLLGIINIIFYGIAEWMGGSTNHYVLGRLGASFPEALYLENSWRLLAAGFLHFGAIHLVMNLVGLKLLGPFVETLMGHAKFLAFYLFCIILSMAAVSALGLAGLIEPELMVGASGGIMGIVGYLAAHFLVQWFRSRTTVNRQRVQALTVALLIQIAFDLSTENVSFAGHASGALGGFLWGIVGALINRNQLRKKRGAGH